MDVDLDLVIKELNSVKMIKKKEKAVVKPPSLAYGNSILFTSVFNLRT